MSTITFITGNQSKADYLEKYLGYPVRHQKIHLDEIQSMNLDEIVTHKVKQAYTIVNGPVLVEDVSLEFSALSGLPGPFIKFFVDNVPFEKICALVGQDDRNATAKCTFGYYDGEHLELFEGSLVGAVATSPAGNNGYGWDKIFIPAGYDVTRAELSESDYKDTYLQIKPFDKLKSYLQNRDHAE